MKRTFKVSLESNSPKQSKTHEGHAASENENSSDLTRREINILTLSAQGKTYGDISALLSITKDTVKAHMESARNKLGAVNKTHAIAIAVSRGLIRLSP